MGKVHLDIEMIECVCGNEISFHELVNKMQDNIEFSDVFETVESVDEYTCNKCGKKYELTLNASVIFKLNSYKLEAKETQVYLDKDNKLVDESYFKTLQIGDETNLWDGTYEVNNKIYRVDDGRMTYILSAETDENQMTIFDYEEVSV